MENKEIISYEEIFKDNNIRKKNDLLEMEKSLYSIVSYLLLFFLGIATLVFSFAITKIDKKSPPSILIEILEVSNNPYEIAFVDKDFLVENQVIDKKYSIVNITNETFNNYIILTKNNDSSDMSWLNREDVISNILTGNIHTWNDSENKIIVNYSATYKEFEAFKKFDSMIYVQSSKFNFYQNNLLLFLTYLITFIVLVLLNYKSLKNDFTILISRENNFFANIANSYLYMLIVSLGLGIVTAFLKSIIGITGDSINQRLIISRLSASGSFYVVLITVILAPVVEEIVFRKSIFGLVKNSKHALIISATTFGLIHLISEITNLFSINSFTFFNLITIFTFSIQYIGMGVFFSYWYYKNNKNTALLIIMHALINLTSLIQLLI